MLIILNNFGKQVNNAKKILVIGSVNVDYIQYVEQFPKNGETIKSNSFNKVQGGKGANQAVAIAKLSDLSFQVSMFAKVGNDGDGIDAINNLKKYNINTEYIYKSQKDTGIALILVSEKQNDNQIIISPGANSDFDKNDLSNLKKAIMEHDYILLQLETNKFLVNNSIKFAKQYNKQIILNPAPIDDFHPKLLDKLEWFIANETEFEIAINTNLKGDYSNKNLDKQIDKIINFGTKNVIITFGNLGLYVKTQNVSKFFKAHEVKSIDPTGAGDTFIGGFLPEFILENNLEKAIKFGMKCSRQTVQKKGAQISIPTRKEVKNEKK